MRDKILTFTIACFAVFGIGSAFEMLLSSPRSVEPEQADHAIFIQVCGHLEAVILTGDSPVIVTPSETPPDGALERLSNVPKERIATMQYHASWCPKPADRA